MHMLFPNMAVSYHAEAEFLPERMNDAMIADDFSVTFGSEVYTFDAKPGFPPVFRVRNEVTHEEHEVIAIHSQQGIEISLNGYSYFISVDTASNTQFRNIISTGSGTQNAIIKVPAPMPGLLKSISVEKGQKVRKGDPLFVLEAMKMENVIKSPIEGIIASLSCEAGTAIEKGHVLCTIGPSEKH